MSKLRKLNVSEIEGYQNSIFPAGTVWIDQNNNLRISDGQTQGGLSAVTSADTGNFRFNNNLLYTQSNQEIWIDPSNDEGNTGFIYIPGPNEANVNLLQIGNQMAGGVQISSNNNNWIFGSGGTLTLPNSTTVGNNLEGSYSSTFLCLQYGVNDQTSGLFSSNSGTRPIFNALIATVTVGWYVSGPGLTGVKEITDIVELGDGDRAFIVDLTDGSLWSDLSVNIPYRFYSSDYALTLNGTKLTVNSNEWKFNQAGHLTVPGDIHEKVGNNLEIAVHNNRNNDGTPGSAVLSLTNNDAVDFQTYTTLEVGAYDIKLNTDYEGVFTGARRTWEFDRDGTLTLPNGSSIESTAGNGIGLTTDRGTILFGNSPEIGAPSHFHIMKPESTTGVDLYFGDDHNFVLQRGTAYGDDPAYGVEIGANDRNEGGQKRWRFGTDGTTSFPSNKIKTSADNSLVIETESLPTEPPTTIVISGADFSPVNLIYNKDGANSIWYPVPYNPATDPYIEFTGGQYGIFVPGFGQALYVNTGTLNIPLAQWNTNPPLGSVAPVGVYNYLGTYTHAWTFGTDGTLTFPGGILTIGNALGAPSIVSAPDTPLNLVSSGNNANTVLGWIDNLETPTQQAVVVANNPLYVGEGDVGIVTGDSLNVGGGTGYIWNFTADGNLIFPDDTIQTTAFTGNLVSTTDVSVTSASNPNNGPFGGMVSGNLEGNGIVVFGPAGGTGEPDELDGVDLTRLVGGTITLSGAEPLSSPILGVTSLGNKLYSIQVEGPLATLTGGEGIGLTITVDPLSTQTWTFGTDGLLTLPVNAAGNSVLLSTAGNVQLYSLNENAQVKIRAKGGDGDSEWKFSNDGTLEFPAGYLLPNTIGSPGQVLTAGGQGSTSWETPTGGVTISKFVMVNQEGTVWGSDDGENWTGPYDTGISSLDRVAVGPSKIVFIGNHPTAGRALFYASAWNSGVTLIELPNEPVLQDWRQVRYFAGIGRFIAVGAIEGVPAYRHSTDGITWTTVSLDTEWAGSLDGGNGYGAGVLTDVATNGTGFLFTTNNTVLGSFYTTTLTSDINIGENKWLNDGMSFTETLYAASGAFTGWFAFGDGNTGAGDGWWYNDSNIPGLGSFVNNWGINDISQAFAALGIGYEPSWSELTIGSYGGVDTIVIATTNGQILYWPVIPDGPFVSIPKPYTNTDISISNASTAVLTVNSGPGVAATGEKITISLADPAEFNGVYYVGAGGELYTDIARTAPLDSTFAGGWLSGTVTFSHGQYIDALNYANGKFYVGNDDEEVFVSADGGATWTEVASLTGAPGEGEGLGYMNDVDGFFFTSSVTTGDVTFNGVKIIGAGTASGDGEGYSTLELVPDNDLYNTNQYLIIDPTNGAPGHIHIRAGGTQDASGADLFLGGEQTHVKVSDTYDNVVIRTSTLGEGVTPHTWTFDNTGNLTLPNSSQIRVDESSVEIGTAGNFNVEAVGVVNVYTDDGARQWQFGDDGRMYLPSIGDGLGAILRSPTNESIGISAYNDTGEGTTYTLSVATTGPINIPTASTGLGRLQNVDGIEILTSSGETAKLWAFGDDGSVTFPDTTVQSTAWTGGRVVTAPTASTGAEGDQQGDIAFTSSHLYYCIANYNQVGHQVTGLDYLGRASLNTNAFQLTKTADTLQITVGDIISDSDGGATSTVVTVSSDDNYTYVGTGGFAYAGVFPLTFTSTDYVSGGNIWKRVAWSGDTW